MRKFLEAQIPETDSSRICIIEWRPSLDYFREDYVKLLSATVEFIKRADAENRTTAAFGRRWVRNFFRNLKLLNQTILYRRSEIPVIVTGSGPSLEQAMPVIRKNQDNCLVIAASSSVMALSAAGIKADMAIATDGGSWALRHIYPFYRDSAAAAFAVNLCAALPSQCACTPHLIINDGSFWQSIVLHELALPSVIIPQRGTVTAAAVELAMILCGGNIYLAGMDLSINDIRTHAKPYAFDSLFFSRACRFAPVYSESFTRSRLIQQGQSMDIYAAWFKDQLAGWPKRIFSLGGGNKVFESALPDEQAVFKKELEFFKAVRVKEDPALFCERGASTLIAAMNDSNYAEKIKKELAPLLFPGENKVTDKEMQKAIKEISDCYRKASYE